MGDVAGIVGKGGDSVSRARGRAHLGEGGLGQKPQGHVGS